MNVIRVKSIRPYRISRNEFLLHDRGFKIGFISCKYKGFNDVIQIILIPIPFIDNSVRIIFLLHVSFAVLGLR